MILEFYNHRNFVFAFVFVYLQFFRDKSLDIKGLVLDLQQHRKWTIRQQLYLHSSLNHVLATLQLSTYLYLYLQLYFSGHFVLMFSFVFWTILQQLYLLSPLNHVLAALQLYLFRYLCICICICVCILCLHSALKHVLTALALALVSKPQQYLFCKCTKCTKYLLWQYTKYTVNNTAVSIVTTITVDGLNNQEQMYRVLLYVPTSLSDQCHFSASVSKVNQ